MGPDLMIRFFINFKAAVRNGLLVARQRRDIRSTASPGSRFLFY